MDNAHGLNAGIRGQTLYASLEVKEHPNARASQTLQGCADRLLTFETDDALTGKILDTYQAMKRANQLSNPSGQWTAILDRSHNQYREALDKRDGPRLREMLQGFFRNELSFALVSHARFDSLVSGQESDLLRFANAILLDIDTWLEFCDSPPLTDLEMPQVGNPYGIIVENSLIVPDACKHNYHARRLGRLMNNCEGRPKVFEIGGGYGGAFWHLWNRNRDRGFCYINCDLEETLFIFFYIVSTCLTLHGKPDPRVKWAIDGPITHSDTEEFDVILVPANRHREIKCGVDIFYNSNSLSEMSRGDVESYFETVSSNRPKFIFHQNSNYNVWKMPHESIFGHVDVLARDFPIDRASYEECYRAISPWMGARGRYREYLFIRKDALR